jgi:orotate phosphoribosyltransferase-like protein
MMEELAQIALLKEAGKSVKEIAIELGVAKNRVTYALAKNKGAKKAIKAPKSLNLNTCSTSDLMGLVSEYQDKLNEIKNAITERIISDEKGLADLKRCMVNIHPVAPMDEEMENIV